MSIKATCKTQIDDEGDLCTVLEGIFGKGKIRVVADGVKVRGYASNIKPTVIIEAEGLYGTAGFYKNTETNKYELVYDNMDARKLRDLLPQKGKDGRITDRLAQGYSRVKVGKALPNLRGSKILTESVDEEGNIKIKLRVTTY